MAAEKWNEEGRIWEADHGLLNEEQIAQCARANEAETFRSPIPTQMVSNGEYMPVPQTKKQKQMEERIKELAESASKKLGISRRRFLAGSSAAGGPGNMVIPSRPQFREAIRHQGSGVRQPAAKIQTCAQGL